MKRLFAILLVLVLVPCAYATDVCNCKGYDGIGGPCYAGIGGPAYAGFYVELSGNDQIMELAGFSDSKPHA